MRIGQEIGSAIFDVDTSPKGKLAATSVTTAAMTASAALGPIGGIPTAILGAARLLRTGFYAAIFTNPWIGTQNVAQDLKAQALVGGATLAAGLAACVPGVGQLAAGAIAALYVGKQVVDSQAS